MPQVPTQINFRNIDEPQGLADQIHDKVAGLEKIYPRLTAARVTIERRDHRRPIGQLFHVLIDVTIPGAELVVSREPSDHDAYQELRTIVHDAFDDIRRQLENHISRQRAIQH